MKAIFVLGGVVAATFAAVAEAESPRARESRRQATVVVMASGATQTAPKVFTPPTVEIQAGDTVQWTNAGGNHNVHFDDDSFNSPNPPSTASWTVSRRFDVAGTYTYRCDVHRLAGMTGTITVKEAPVATPTPTPPPPPAGGAPPSPPPQLRSLKLVRTSFCTQRSRTCKRPGVVLLIDLSAPATVRGTLRRASLRGKARYQAFGSVDFGQVAAGPRELRFTRTKTNRRLTPARYRLVLQTAGTTRTFSFRVRR